MPAVALAVAAAALLALVAAPVAPAVAGLALAGALAGGLFALHQGWHFPLAAPLATLPVALAASFLLGRAPKPPPEPG